MPGLAPSAVGGRIRQILTAALARLGMGESAFLVLLAILIGTVTAVAAVAFHELIQLIRDWLYIRLDPRADLYGSGLWLLIVLPAAGGLLVGIISNWIVRAREGRGLVDVLESVLRSRGAIKPVVAFEKIITSAITIGSGGSAGAEGPIVQIGASIASGIGQFFRVLRPSMPVLIGCGSAAGISAIFNSPIGGVLFTLEVVLHDFSIRTFTPVVLASVVANVTTQAVFRHIHHVTQYEAIFNLPNWIKAQHLALAWDQVPAFILLGLICGIVGVVFTRLMHFSETRFEKVPIARVLRPAAGGALLGLLAIAYVTFFGWWILGAKKPFAFEHYPMPAFFGDGYGVIRRLHDATFYQALPAGLLLSLLGCLIVLKIVGTCLTLGSGGSGGIIAPSLFLGAVTGAGVGLMLRLTGWFGQLQPEMYALAGMGAVLGAVVHAPLAGILILFDVTRDDKVMLPAMLTTITAVGLARLLFKESIYTLALRKRGVSVGRGAFDVLQRLTVEQVPLEPAVIMDGSLPLEQVLLGSANQPIGDIIVAARGVYAGMVSHQDLQTALWQREAMPLLTLGDIVRDDVPLIRASDDLASVLDVMFKLDLAKLPVGLPQSPGKVIGMVSRAAVINSYQRAIAESR